jgi:hypothetical protein
MGWERRFCRWKILTTTNSAFLSILEKTFSAVTVLRYMTRTRTGRMTECTGGISTGGIRTTSECEWPGAVMAHRVPIGRCSFAICYCADSSFVSFDFFFSLRHTIDLCYMHGAMRQRCPFNCFFHYSVDIFRSVQFVTWQATILAKAILNAYF